MRNRDLIGPRDLFHIFLAALVMTLVVCGIPYVAAGGPLPSMHLASANSVQKPVVSQKMQPYQSPAVQKVAAAVSAWPKAYQVIQGDSLSTIAGSLYGDANDWTVLYWANKQEIHSPNLIFVGENLTVPALPAHIPAPPAVTAPSAPRPVTDVVTFHAQSHQAVEHSTGTYGHPYYCGDGDGDGWDVPCPGTHASAPVSHSNSGAKSQTISVSFSASGVLTAAQVGQLWLAAGGPSWAEGSAEAVAHCESGYNTRAYNPSGASGLWQILGSVVGGNLFDGYTNALNAVAKFKASGDTWAQWVCKP